MKNRNDQLQQLFKEGSELLQAGAAEEALLRFQAALNIAPANAILHLFAGAALHSLGRHEEAVAVYQAAIAMAPDMGEAHNNLGNSLMALNRYEAAAESFFRASGLLPSSPVPLTARGTALQALGKVTEAENDCRKALTLDPSFAVAHWNLALNLLLQGRYAEGWQEYEWRWQKPDFTSPCRHTETPLWDGSPLNGHTILLHAEQGFGDAIQFIRYSTLVAEHGGKVLVECHPQLVQLLRTVAGVQWAFPFGAPLPPFSCQAPLLSLPHVFSTTAQDIPSRCPYMAATDEYRLKWSALLSATPAACRIGLVWAGKSYPDPGRSCRLAELAPLAADDLTFFSLQLGESAGQAALPPSGMQLIDLTGNISDFADTAALIERMDLIISIDTAVAHLAGALGKPVWLLLPFAPDWRWLLDREDSPWYPGMRLFRQEKPGEWGPVIGRVVTELSKFQKKTS